MVHSLFLLANAKLVEMGDTSGKELLLQSMNFPKECEELYLSPTLEKRISLKSSDGCGINLELRLKKQNGTVLMLIHKKRTYTNHLIFSDSDGEVIHVERPKNLELTPFRQSILQEFPCFIQEYIKNFNKKWKNLMPFGYNLSKLQSNKNRISINIKATGCKRFKFNC